MIEDNELVLSKTQVVTASAASTVAPYIGAGNTLGKPLYLQINCEETADSSTDAATVTFVLETSSASGFGTKTVLLQSGSFAIASAALTAGNVAFKVRLPGEGMLGYVRVYYTIGTENLSKGKFTAFLTDAVETKYAVS